MDRIASILPAGGGDLDTHHGARRASRRYPLNADVEVIEPRETAGIAINASAGGMRIALDEPLAVGDLAVLRVRTDSRELIEHVRVVWTKPFADGCLVGVEFVSVS